MITASVICTVYGITALIVACIVLKLEKPFWLFSRVPYLTCSSQVSINLAVHDGFQECMRVLKEDGVLIFKWAETDIPAQKVWKAIGQKPLFGHHSGKRSGTFWGCYMKGQE